MSKLDEIIARLAEQEEEPAAGHFERFSAKLMKQRKKIRLYSSVLKVAAVFVLLVLSANLFFYLKDQKAENRLSLSQSDEIREAEIYYSNLINSGMGDLEIMAKEGIGSEKEVLEVRKELSEMDSQYRNLEKDYRSNPGDERVRSAVIEYYQAKLEILNTVKSGWENAGQLKNRYNENIKS
jgi:hypothetical protein